MSNLIIQCIFLTVCIINIDCEIYQDRPKIKTANGDLILEPAFDKNIYFLPNGPKSKIFVGEKNILEVKVNNQNINEVSNDYDDLINGQNGILKRLENLEKNRVTSLPNDVFLNISTLWRRVGNLQRKVHNLQSVLSSRRTDGCQSHPCKHGGTCLNLFDGYHCLCLTNWEGQDCDEDVNECRNFAGTDLGCQNGATCVNKPGSYECLCKPKWFGIHCTRREKDCTGGDFEMCGHGRCVPTGTGDGITCICDQGWTTNGTGSSCLTDINECDTRYGPHCSVNPRVECINVPGSFRCGQCPIGYEGDGYVCSDIDECVVLPNGGCNPMVSCHNTVGSRVCGSCPPGYIGDGVTCTWRGSCNINHGGCHPSAQCVENTTPGGQVTQCICPDGMEGDGTGLMGCYVPSRSNRTLNCYGNPCGIHGQCHVVRNGYTCICLRGYGGPNCDVATDPCAVNPCHNHGICRRDDTTSRGFRCECTAQYTGPLCQVVSRTCGGMLDNEEGSIVYPTSNTTYSHNSRCAWVIHTVPGKVINVTFTKFNVEDSPECSYDFLQIHDGRSSASQLIGRFCGNNFPKGGNIISSHNYLYFWFRSDSSVAKTGIALHWTSINPVCGGEVNAVTHGHISSPGSPGKYPPNRDCLWHLRTSFGRRIQIHFFALDLEKHANCSFDYLAIYDGSHDTDPLLNKYCNSSQPAPIVSAGPELLVHFHSDAFGAGYGFQLAYAPAEGVPGCGGYFTADNGEVFSPSLNGTYLNNLLCEYKIKTSVDTKIRIDFKQFGLERSFKCKFDYLKIYDGESSDAPLVGRFCGSNYPKSYVASSNKLYMEFHSDLTVSSIGFKMTYQALCQMNLIGDSGVIKSPGYPFNYPNNKVCEYVISTTPGKAIMITFQDFDIESGSHNNNCMFDFVEIRDGADSNSSFIGKFCGSSRTVPTITSTHNYMYVKFKSDLSVSGTGFYANYTTVDTECGGIYTNTIGVINHPSEDATAYNNDQLCSWMLVAPAGMHIKLTWNRFQIEKTPSCIADYLELIEIDQDNVYNSIGQFCGTKSPPALTVSANRLMIKFKSDSNIQSSGFSLSYTFLDEKTHCGGVFLKSHGYIYSPGWPKRYENNRDCKWTITVPAGHQVRVNITQFDLESPTRGTCIHGDYLELRNGASQASLIGQFCGKFQSKVITSLGNTLFIHFHSDFYLTGDGFKIEWNGNIFGCGGTLTGPSGAISSPNYPENYDENSECFYKIITSFGSRIRLTFTELDLERTHNCKDDYVEIFDGRDTNAPTLGKNCYMTTGLNNIISSTNNVYIKFRSDFYNEGKGFLLNYFTVCNNNLTGRYGVIESPGYPDNYPLHSNCLWNINVPKGNKINITFSHFDIYRHRIWYTRNYKLGLDCREDYFQWKDSTDLNFSPKTCGSTAPPGFTTKSNSLQIKFASGRYNSRSGFRLEWTIHGCGGHIQKDYGTIDTRQTSDELECEWLIETSAGSKINLVLTSLYLFKSVNCSTDAISIYNGQDTSAPLITSFCDKQTTVIQSSANYMFIQFAKHSNLQGAYFTSLFHVTKARCGGIIQSTSGYIYSKNYPQNYDNNLDCIWTISVPINHRIHLTFEDLDLYSYSGSESKCGDSIRIYDARRLFRSNYTQRICGMANITELTTKYNDIKVQFTSDNAGNAKGFKIHFRATCGGEITANEDGIISNYNYIPVTNETCLWTIVAPKLEQKISLTITHLDLPKWNTEIQSNRSCSLSYLRVYDGNDVNAPVLDEYCGSKAPPVIVSHGSFMTVLLGSYTNEITGHFAAHYSVLSTACGGTFTSEQGSIVSPNYPREYPINADCEWILSTSPGNKVAVIFEQFDLEDSDRCNEDYVEIREGLSSGPLLGVYCGSSVPINITSGQKLYVKFHSNEKNNGKGFLLHYEFMHGNEIMGLASGEIASPLYPHTYKKAGEYSWRIYTDSSSTITLSIDTLEIHTYTDTCSSKLSLYDGYDDTAPLIDELCGILRERRKVLQTSSNVAFIKLIMDESNTGAIFHLRWAKSDQISNLDDDGDKVNCGSNTTIQVNSGSNNVVRSPGYPNAYGPNLNCEWVYKADTGRHLRLRFQDFRIEEENHCFNDYVSVYSASVPGQWTPVVEKVCKQDQVSQYINSSTYMKIIFKTDYSVERKGFQGRVISACGGLITDSSGDIDLLKEDVYQIPSANQKLTCEWVVKVRPGRLIKLDFVHFNITNSETECRTDVTLRNGDSTESPLLSSGRYCGYSHEVKSGIVTTSNALHIAFTSTRVLTQFQHFKIHYEEVNIECGATSNLNQDHSWEIISSTNYPSVPAAFSECIWVFTGPPGEILQIDFLDRFDLDSSNDCGTEVVEIRDGSSGLAPLKGRFCNEKPGTIKTTSNTLFVRYLTQLAVPRNGFKANVSISVCGGTIRASEGEITSPYYPHNHVIPDTSVCEWHIQGRPYTMINIYPNDIDIPDTEPPCATNITIERMTPGNNSISIIKTYCYDDDFKSHIETFTNNVTIKFNIATPSKWVRRKETRGFRFSFNSSKSDCGGEITTSEGFVATPGYPLETNIIICQWLIHVPDRTRRIHVDLIDFNPDKQSIITNEHGHVTRISSMFSNSSQLSRSYDSSGPDLYLLVQSNTNRHRFKARFTSNDPALCGGDLNGLSGEIVSPDSSDYICQWNYNTRDRFVNHTFDSLFKTILVTVQLNSSITNSRCRFYDSKLNIMSSFSVTGTSMSRTICRNTQTSFRLPSRAATFRALKSTKDSFDFKIQYRAAPCGGVINVANDPVNVLVLPTSFNTTIDCAWIVRAPNGNKVQLNMEGSFKHDCDDEYIKISQGFSQYSLSLGKYCKDQYLRDPLITNFRNIFIEYHSRGQDNSNLKLIVNVTNSQCGGDLFSGNQIFSSPNYPKNYNPNQECTWIITTNLGDRVSLKFVDRFVIEDKPNCTKDAVIIYDWKDNSYKQMAKLCGRNTPISYNSTYNKMKVVFRTDESTNLEGFRAIWMSKCGGSYLAKENQQLLYSPGYPGDYRAMENCKYRITAPPDKKVIVKFLNFNLEGNYPECEYDNLTIYAYDNNFNAVYCGSQVPPVIKNVDSVQLVFKSDRFVSDKGFLISYSIYQCGMAITEPTVITLNDNGEDYDNNMNCTWVIRAPSNKVVVLKFIYIDIETTHQCQADYVAVYNNSIIDDDKRLALLCGRLNASTVLRTTNNVAVIQFVSDQSYALGGFKVQVLFSYSEAVGCGGHIDMTSLSTRTLKSFFLGDSHVYENNIDCVWTITSPPDTTIKIYFVSFHISPCSNILNQTAIGYSNCDCDFVEIKDGINIDSSIIGTYCGHTLPPTLSSSRNVMSVRFSTDGELNSSGFEATLSVLPSVCGKTHYLVSNQIQTIRSPSLLNGAIPRNLHCVFYIDSSHMPYSIIRLSIKQLDLQPESDATKKCSQDKLLLSVSGHLRNNSHGKDLIVQYNSDSFISTYISYEDILPTKLEFCGSKKPSDLYFTGSIAVTLMTSSDAGSKLYKGVEIEFETAGICGRNYTGTQGKIMSHNSEYDNNDEVENCYTLITGPENYTISLYFINLTPDYWSQIWYFKIYDGNNVKAPELGAMTVDYGNDYPVFFSTGRYMLLHQGNGVHVEYELNFVATDKGRGCGGKLTNELGRVTSPMYPDIYRQKSACEWELQTPLGTNLKLHFAVFDLGRSCDQNYLQLVNSKGEVISTYCSEKPADYTSSDNFVKIVFHTTQNNGGTGWVADFVGIPS